MQTVSIERFMHVHNFIFVVTGIVMISVGATARAQFYPYYIFLDKRYFSVANLLIATGSLIFLVGLLGTYGTLNEKWNVSTAKIASRRYCVLMIMIFVFELSVSMGGYVLRDAASTHIESTMYAKMNDYGRLFKISAMWDFIQEELKCCGVQNYHDWETQFHNNSLPISCCKFTSGAEVVGTFYCGSVVNSENTVSIYADSSFKPYSSGCHSLLSEFVKKYAVIMGAVGTLFSVLQLGGIFVSIHLARQFKNTYYTTFYI